MASSIVVRNNPLRLLSKTLLYLAPVKLAGPELKVGGKYSCEHPLHGHLGEVELLGFFISHLYNLSPAVQWNSEGHNKVQEMFQQQGCNKVTPIQVCTFHFLRRRDEAFKALLDVELLHAGVEIVRQPNLL